MSESTHLGRYANCIARWTAALFVTLAASQSAAATPHILIIYADQFRSDCIGAMGHPDIQTPHLDALAADGVLYRNSFCTWPVCTPSRISLLTGMYVQQHRARSNRSTVPPQTPTFPSLLRKAGYNTTAVGKMHFTPAYQDVGFDTMLLAEQNGRGRNIDDYHRYLRDRGLINAIDLIDQERDFRRQAPPSYRQTFGARVSDLPDEHHITTWVADRALETVTRWTNTKSELLMVGFLKPHHPLDPPAPWHEIYDEDELTVLPGWTDQVPDRDWARAHGYFDNSTLTIPALRRAMAYYYATITHMDHHIGRIIAELKRKGIYDQTLIVFTADHGEYLGFHHLLLKGNNMYDPLTKVPLIVKFPHQRHAGAVSDELVNALDLTATILAEAGLNPTAEMRGAPLGAQGAGRQRPRKFVIVQDRVSVMVRSQTRKLIVTQNPADSMFFDLQHDPLEMENRIGDARYAADIARMKDDLLDWFLNESARQKYEDANASVVAGPNVPTNPDALEREMLQYFEEKVGAFLENDRWEPEN